ncbi:PAS domain S-box protein [Dactylosporangium aurantiacum]|uniref:histidine kinase n=1 Tax=Dactylosporangium aurantiacum TaxID=35754 RepID=A0A9Q9IDZ1_9ACTN|nr:ATP-binding protein [Dactylosporangium aurantiacum]MDG6102065.1 ATP-binding protein [Dactylosporangium aurantiacum]UWZ53601.1 PAS domain S-box protein [Dactylosporangium aurantiacum]
MPKDRELVLVSLLQEATRIANEADDITDAGLPVIKAVCAATGWDAGHLCLPDPRDRRVFVSTDIWYEVEPGSFAGLRAASTGFRFTYGGGVVGQAATTGRPVWIPAVAEDRNFVRARLAGALEGVGAAIAFPVIARGVTAAVLEFFTREPAAPDARLLEIMADVGIQLGRVADRMAATQAVRFGAERMERILDSCVEAFVAMDEGGMITGWNAAAEKVFGLSKEEAIGRRLADTIVPPRFREAHHLGIGRFLTTGEKRVLDNRIEISAWHANGYEFPVELAVWAVPDPMQGWSFNAFVHDITDRKRTEDALRAAYEHEREAVSRLRELDVAKSDFVATVSHEFRTPLTNVIGHLEVLASGDAGELNPAQTRMLQVIGRNSDRLRALIEDLLTISKVEAGVFDLELVTTDLTEVLVAAHAAVEARASRRDHRLELAIAPRLGTIDADPEQLRRALVNLLVNAVNFTPDGGLIELTAKLDGADVVIKVRDTGVGIDPAEQGQLFTRFFRGTFAVREAVQGAGLGLAITKTIVEGHGGEVAVDSVVGAGTTFTVRIPRERPLWL